MARTTDNTEALRDFLADNHAVMPPWAVKLVKILTGDAAQEDVQADANDALADSVSGEA